jgi:heptosyltransferase-2
MQKILVIQTAFIGDVVLATALLEKLAASLPEARIDMLVRKGNEGLLANNPHLHQVLIWNKKQEKQRNLLRMLRLIRRERYEKVINLQRFFATGLLTAFSGAKETYGFRKNPLSFLFTHAIEHIMDAQHAVHEVDRNNQLVASLVPPGRSLPKLYPSDADFAAVAEFVGQPFITISPTSVWFTKQFPPESWVAFLKALPKHYTVHLLGGPDNLEACEAIRKQVPEASIQTLAGKLSFLQSAALMSKAVMNYVNDSAPLHFASAMNAPVTAVFCSTVPAFGFTPLSENSHIVEIQENLSCRPCGLHGKTACPLGHFRCAYGIQTSQLLECLPV